MIDDFPDWAKGKWCLYDDTNGNIKLKHCWPQSEVVPCPSCSKPLNLSKVNAQYSAECCGETFYLGWGHVTQGEPTGKHLRKVGRGWQSLRLWNEAGEEGEVK